MSQNIYDSREFFEGYCRLPRSICGLGSAPEWRAVRALLPAIARRRVLDLGCGFGWFSRWAAEQGAANVLGLDLSENMLARARRDTHSPQVDYQTADLETLTLPDHSFDLAYSALAFHYVADFRRLVGTVHRSLTPGSRFVFTIEHPIYMAPTHPGWLVDGQGRMTWPVNRYSHEGERRTDWLASGVIKHHRTIGTTLNTLIGAGFVVDRVLEWSPDAGQIEEEAALAEEAERPMFLIVAAHR